MKKTSADTLAAKATAKLMLIENKILKPPVPVVKLAEQEGLKTFEVQFEEALIISGFIDLENFQIIVNEMEEKEIQTFTIARALGHWMLHRNELHEIPELKVIYQQSLGGKLKNFYEKEAQYFALNLLVPENFLQNKVQMSSSALAVMFNVPNFVIDMARKDYQ